MTTDPAMFADAHKTLSHRVPICRAAPQVLAEYGRLVLDFDAEEVERVTWPKPTGWRQIKAGTGNHQTVVVDHFRLQWKDDILYGDNMAVGSAGLGFVTGRLSRDRRHVLVRDVNYHPDGGQVFSLPAGLKIPFVMLLAPASVGDDVTLEDFRAFWFDGSQGFQIAPGVWHTSPFFAPPPANCGATDTATSDEVLFRNKQSSIFACVEIYTDKEFGTFLEVPLTMDS